jgi:hypothetical protein
VLLSRARRRVPSLRAQFPAPHELFFLRALLFSAASSPTKACRTHFSLGLGLPCCCPPNPSQIPPNLVLLAKNPSQIHPLSRFLRNLLHMNLLRPPSSRSRQHRVGKGRRALAPSLPEALWPPSPPPGRSYYGRRGLPPCPICYGRRPLLAGVHDKIMKPRDIWTGSGDQHWETRRNQIGRLFIASSNEDFFNRPAE